MLINSRLTEGRHLWENAGTYSVYVFLIRRKNLDENGFDGTHRTSIWSYGLLGQSEGFIIAEMGIVQCLF
jgi:hypothetical protein